MHWYDKKGQPAYEVKGANGKMRPTTLRDARKLHLVPSVTTVMSVQDKPALINWLQNQILDACVSNPYHPLDGVSEKEWRYKIMQEARSVGKAAADNGTIIHDAIEEALKNNNQNFKTQAVVNPVLEFLDTKFKGFEWVAEDSFTHPLGFGGKIDLYGVKNKGKKTERRMVLDFKTKLKSAADIKKLKTYDDHHIQTAAYVKGIEDTKELGQMMDYQLWERYNLFIGYELDKKGVFAYTGTKLTQSKDFEREWGMFEKLLEFWQLKNKYVPEGL